MKKKFTTELTASKDGVTVMGCRVLVNIASCHKHRAWQQSQRDTWLPELRCDYRFFLGNPKGDAEQDEVFLDCPDDYNSLIYKTLESTKWALEHGYDFMFKCDVDTLVNPRNLLSSDFELHNYTGGRNGHFASGGSGYWLSRKAMEALVTEPPKDGSAEDVFVADTVWRKHNLPLHEDNRYLYYPGCKLGTDTVTFHVSSCNGWPGDVPPYNPSMMHNRYLEMKDSKCLQQNCQIDC
jgi:hypothetical protein